MKRIVLLILSLSLLLCACSASPSPTQQGNGTQARTDVIVAMGVNSEPESGFDPAFGWGAGEHVHEPLIQSTLLVTDLDLKLGHDLATTYSVSEDGLTWTVKIRTDVKFSDGTPLTAADVAFTYNNVKAQSSVNDFTMLGSAQAQGDDTVLFHMNRPFSIWPYTMAIVGIVPESSYSEGYGQSPIGSGRYVLKQWDKGQQVILEANPLYYGEAPKMQKVTILFMSEEAAFAAAKSGQVDLAYTAAAYAGNALSGMQLLSFTSVDNRGISLPCIPYDGNGRGNDVTCDLAIRRAINLGLDRQGLVDHILDGHGTPAFSVCDNLPWYNEASEIAHNLQEANALLDAAGWAMGGDGIRQKDGVSASFTLLYPSGDSLRQALAAEIKNQLMQIGIEANPEGVGWDTAYDRANADPMIWGWGAHTPMELYNIYRSDSELNAASYKNEAVDAYMEAALAASSDEEAYELWKKAQWDGQTGVTAEGGCPWAWLVNVNHLYFASENLQVAEQKIHPHGHGWSIVNNVDLWYWQ